MSARPRLLLLDACAVFEAFACDGWAALCRSYEIVVPSIIVRREVEFYEDAEGRRQPLDLRPLVADGTIREYTATAAELAETAARFHPEFRPRVHDGELEALTYLRVVEPDARTAFVTADGGAIEATVLLGMSNLAMSLATALQKCGCSKNLDFEFTDAFLKRKVRDGGERLATGRGLSTPPGQGPKRRS